MKTHQLITIKLHLRTIAAIVIFAIAQAQVAFTQEETYKDVIEKAHNLILQKDRTQAIQVLLNAIKKEKNKTAVVEIKKKIEELGTIFLSDKAQQFYETSLSIKRKDLSQATLKINEALRLEPDNVQVLVEAARLQILKGECANAQDQILKIYSKNKYDELVILTMGQIQQCLGAMDQYFNIRSTVEAKKLTENIDWQILELQRELFEKDKLKVKSRLAVLQKADSKNPQLLYWQWRLSKLEGNENATLKEKYILSCNNISAQVFRVYQKDPYFCNKQNEMEADSVKK